MEETNPRVELYTNTLYSGMILKGELYTEEGDVVYPANRPLTKELIAGLVEKNIKKVFYNKPSILETDKKPLINQEILEKAYAVSEEIGYAAVKKTPLPEKEINETIDQFIEKVAVAEKGTILNLTELQEFDEHTYLNSVNVALISVLFAKLLNWQKDQIKMLGIGALLHDVGKTLVPKDVLNKSNDLTSDEFEIIKKHAIYGYNLLKSQTTYDDQILRIALMHHENWDGSGYPFGVTSDRIEDMSQIVSLCDFYVAATSEKTYREKLTGWKVFLLIRKNMNTKFNPRLAVEFINKMPSYLLQNAIFNEGHFVMLNTHELAEIVQTNPMETMKPKIQILTNAAEESLRYPLPIDLAMDEKRWIESIIEEKATLDLLNEIKAALEKKSTANPEK